MLTIITGSERKKGEIKKYIDGRVEYKFISHDLEEIQGSAQEIIKNKVYAAYEIVKGPVVVEDYSLYIDLLCGFPGPYVKSLLLNGELGEIVSNLSPLGKISCTAECLYGYIDKNNKYHLFSTKEQGYLMPSKENTSGLFGVDMLLVPKGADKPFFYLTEQEKDERSIRRKTINKLIEHLQNEE
ncbi:inosine triphosphate pyrophosphatase [Nematocida minor]|uniref:inosine triphosphate pyrophosphatase n=1 Tax=Nematocida minor TaxID=1912983 RepID=UPI00221FCC9C|nr:inosine triphosphate pyrophosphatase [Nematocida minor]KAI5189139.1 inosine triphosphate pyrophosphatase [Nematocida minor]